MTIEQGNGEMTEKANVCENKLVEESDIVKSRYSPLCRQFVAAIGCTATTISVGMTIGYSAILLPELQHPSSRIHVDLEIASWIASIALLPMAFGCLVAGYLMDRFGRKMTILALNVPFTVGWCIISMSDCMFWLLFGRILTGFCCGVLSPTTPMYLSEISAPKYRGFFLASITLDVALGVLLTHFLAIYCTWNVNAIVCGFLPFIGYIATTFVPESPSWLLKKNCIHEAHHAFVWLRGCDESASIEFQSMVDAQIKNSAATSAQHSDDDTENNGSGAGRQHHPIDHLRQLIAHKSFNTPLIILSIYFATLQFSGVNAVIFYTVTILKDSLSGTDIDEYVATLVIDAVRLVAALIACIVVKCAGRRPLTIFSGGSTAICLFGLSYYLSLSAENSLRNYASIPLALFVIYTLVLSVGINPLPWCLTGELFPLRYRAIGSAFVTAFNFLCFFTVVKTSPIYFSIYGGSKMFCFYGILTAIGTIFLTLVLPETKNKSLQEIEDNYTVKRKHKMSRNKVQP
ncbi:facilitated trehalose transporter Tret1-like [Sitodiplosis mosellana]|uniref:facilitated trehalose transporter Tret1-like n=1 Tax=Sitodiplosis mosellana TaxID=263140 RepID=UPI002444B0B4|nr:facilitated trehalose transporter Tret1-like [Sitodiplosis mosellana]